MKELAPRAGGFEPLRFLPKGKMIVLGLVSTKVAPLETVAELKRRIDEASKYVPLEQIAISPQCGFSSDVVGNLLRRSKTEARGRRRNCAAGVGLVLGPGLECPTAIFT